LILNSLSRLYGAAASRRRHWYARDPQRRRSLSRPVVSIGNLCVGGAGKTPIVAYIARLLRDHGEHPAILTRGYGRRRAADGVTVVSDGRRVIADLASAGDEPLMLARALPGVPVLVAADRYLAGIFAERQLGARVHLLDDGFQHVQLTRAGDLLLAEEADLVDRPFPAGRLREPLTSARAATAVLVSAGYTTAAERIGRALGVETAFCVARTLGVPCAVAGGDSVVIPAGSRVFAVTGIARPDRFFSDVTAGGWELVGSIAFRDHHHFTRRDVARISAAAKSAAAAIVLTTEKDAVRLEACDLGDLPIALVPLAVSIEPAAAFREWLLQRL